VNFRVQPGNGAFPQGNKIGFTTDFRFQFSGGSANGVQFGESLGIRFNLAGLFDDFVSALKDDKVRIGMHIQELPPRGRGSDSIVSGSPSVIPLPAGALLLISAFGVAIAGRRVLMTPRA
jgi:hypothetical protein